MTFTNQQKLEVLCENAKHQCRNCACTHSCAGLNDEKLEELFGILLAEKTRHGLVWIFSKNPGHGNDWEFHTAIPSNDKERIGEFVEHFTMLGYEVKIV